MSTLPHAFSQTIQTNTPGFQKILIHKNIESFTGTQLGCNSVVAQDYSTTKKLISGHSRGLIMKTKQDNLLSERVDGGQESHKPGEFATPKVSRVKPKIIHQEKLQSRQPRTAVGVNNGSSGRSSAGVPTAHVMPNMTFDHNFASLSSASMDAGSIPRSGSVDRLQHHHMDVMSSHLPEKRWGSYDNVTTQDPYATAALSEQFQHLSHDTDATFIESADVYSRYRQQLHGMADKYDSRFMESKAVPVAEEVKQAISYQYHSPVPADVTNRVSMATDSHGYGYAYPSQNQHSTLSSSMYSHGGREVDLSGTRGVAGSAGYSHSSSSLSGDTFNNDLTHWQQRHQEQLHRQHFEASQVVAQPVLAYPSNVSSYSRSLSSYPSQTSVSSGHLHDPHKLDAVKQAADNIIREKDNIIDRQKLKLLEYEDRTKPSNRNSQSNLLKTSSLRQDSPSTGIKLQELQYENASLKAQLTEVIGRSGNCDLAQLQRQLGKAEYELSELKTSTDAEVRSKDAAIKDLQDQLVGQDGACLEWKDKHLEMKKAHDTLERKLENYQRYLEDLPTADEQSKHSQEMKALKDDRAKYKHRVAELDKRLADAKKAVKSRDGLIESLEGREAQLNDQLQAVKAEVGKRPAELSRLKSGDETQSGDDIEQLKYDNQRMKADCDRAKKLMETQHKRQQMAVQKYQKEVKRLEERLSQEEAAVTGLKDEAGGKEQHLKKLRQSVKELGSQNQDLLEKNLALGDKVKELDRQQTGELHKLERRLLREMSVCFSELQSLVEVCAQRAEGQNPDISMLLGVKSSALDSDQGADHSIQSMHYKVDKVGELRKQIDGLREVISTKLAEEMGDNLNCTQQ